MMIKLGAQVQHISKSYVGVITKILYPSECNDVVVSTVDTKNIGTLERPEIVNYIEKIENLVLI